MPAYDFRCTTCRHTFEVVRAAGETTPPECPECGGESKRVFSPVGIHFKGSGFHSTDYKADNACPAPVSGTCEAAGTPDCACHKEAVGE